MEAAPCHVKEMQRNALCKVEKVMHEHMSRQAQLAQAREQAATTQRSEPWSAYRQLWMPRLTTLTLP